MNVSNIKIDRIKAGIYITDTNTGKQALITRVVLECYTQLPLKEKLQIERKIIQIACNYGV